MTTAIEQAKREMYLKFGDLYQQIMGNEKSHRLCKIFESALESYLEQLRQQYEEMASTAHQRFESIQSLEAANQKLSDSLSCVNKTIINCAAHSCNTIRDLEDQLAKMTESRDMFRNLHQAATHSSIERVGQASTSGQASGDRASCEQLGGQKAAIDWGGEGLPPVGAVCDYRSDKWPEELWERRTIRYISDYHVVTAEYDGIERSVPAGLAKFRPISTPEQIADDEKSGFIIEMAAELSGHSDHIRTEDLGMAKYLWSKGYRKMLKPSCMHSFFAIGSDQFKCTFCGVGK